MKRVGDRATAILLPYGDPTNYNETEILKMLKNKVGQIDVAAKILRRSLK